MSRMLVKRTVRLASDFGCLVKRKSHAAIVEAENLFPSWNSHGLIVLDDCFPNLLTAFRIAEYNAYLREFPDSHVYSTTHTFNQGHSFSQLLDQYSRFYPDLAPRVRQYHPQRRLRGKLAYTVFINNAIAFLDVIERSRIPFAFTLYPGGGFQLNDAGSDRKLRRVCASPWLRQIFTTQRVTQDYLIAKQFVDRSKIQFIYGAVLPLDRYSNLQRLRQRKGVDKTCFDICFVAAKYSPRGVDKGYDTFIEVAHRLACVRSDVNFHVVGNFDEHEIDVSEIRSRFRFHGPMVTDDFPVFYAQMDVIVSPNIPFRLAPGAFDGFPTGCCMEAGASGTVVMCSDVLGLNESLRPNEEIILVAPEPAAFAREIEDLLNQPRRLQEIGERGSRAMMRLFGYEAQMEPRLSTLKLLMEPRHQVSPLSAV